MGTADARDLDSEDGQDTAPSQTSRGHKLVVAIGIDHYRDRRWRTLKNAANDARGAVREFRRHGFELVRRPDGSEIGPLIDDAATHDAIRDLFLELRRLETDDTLIVFFAGHGHTVERKYPHRIDRTGYLIPTDAVDERRWISIDPLLREIAHLRPRHILVVLDACFSGIALDDLNSFVRWRGDREQGPLATLQERVSRHLIASALGVQRAQDGGAQGHSLFTACLIQGLSYGNIAKDRSYVTVEDLGSYVQRRVSELTNDRQTPIYGEFEGDDNGELVIELSSRGDDWIDRHPPRQKKALPSLVAAATAVAGGTVALAVACPGASRSPVLDGGTPSPPDTPLANADPCRDARASV